MGGSNVGSRSNGAAVAAGSRSRGNRRLPQRRSRSDACPQEQAHRGSPGHEGPRRMDLKGPRTRRRSTLRPTAFLRLLHRTNLRQARRVRAQRLVGKQPRLRTSGPPRGERLILAVPHPTFRRPRGKPAVSTGKARGGGKTKTTLEVGFLRGGPLATHTSTSVPSRRHGPPAVLGHGRGPPALLPAPGGSAELHQARVLKCR